jgi:hypothetical protein
MSVSMLKINVIVFFALFLSLCWAAEYDDELLRLADLIGKKDYSAAIEGYQKLANSPSSPGWLKAGSYFEIASVKLQQGKQEDAFSSLDQAIQNGFNDCFAIQQDVFADVRSSPDIQRRLAAMKISEADYAELFWLKTEMNNLEHDIKMMITENINRLDDDFTETPQSEIPTRETKSAAVLYARENVRLMQEIQKTYVKQSDEERIQHNATMRVINGEVDQQAILISKQEAAENADVRRKAVTQRAFQNSDRSNEPKPCSEYTTAASSK